MYVVEEWQGQNENSLVTIGTPVQKADYYEAEGEYLIKQGYACMSNIPYHMVRLSDHTGYVVMHKCYTPERLARFNQQEGGGSE